MVARLQALPQPRRGLRDRVWCRDADEVEALGQGPGDKGGLEVRRGQKSRSA